MTALAPPCAANLRRGTSYFIPHLPSVLPASAADAGANSAAVDALCATESTGESAGKIAAAAVATAVTVAGGTPAPTSFALSTVVAAAVFGATTSSTSALSAAVVATGYIAAADEAVAAAATTATTARGFVPLLHAAARLSAGPVTGRLTAQAIASRFLAER